MIFLYQEIYKETIKMCYEKYVWDILSKIDMKGSTKKKNHLDYISWTDQWKMLKNNFPRSQYKFKEKTHADGSMTIESRVRISEHRQGMPQNYVDAHIGLAVMDHRNKALINPSATAINNTKARCLVKAIALHGLGLHVYAGEDLVHFDDPAVFDTEEDSSFIDTKEFEQITKLCVKSNTDLERLAKAEGVEDCTVIRKDRFKHIILMLNTKIKRQKIKEGKNNEDSRKDATTDSGMVSAEAR